MKTCFTYFCKLITFPGANLLTKKIEGRDNLPREGPFIVASNHINSIDIWFIGNVLKERIKDLRFVAAMESFKILLMSGLLYYLADAIIINRKRDGREDILKKIIERLKMGNIVVLFPEGNTNPKRELLRGKTGVAEIAFKTGFPIIPLGIRKDKSSSQRIIEIGKPLYLFKEGEFKDKMENNKEKYDLFLRKTTDRIMREISKLSQKPYPYDN